MRSHLLTLATRADQTSDDASRLALAFANRGMVSASQHSTLQAVTYADVAAKLREMAFDLAGK